MLSERQNHESLPFALDTYLDSNPDTIDIFSEQTKVDLMIFSTSTIISSEVIGFLFFEFSRSIKLCEYKAKLISIDDEIS